MNEISMMHSAWGIYFEENQLYLQPKKSPIPVALVLFSEKDKSVHLYRLKISDDKVQKLAESVLEKIQKWIDKQKSPSSLLLENSSLEGSESGYPPWTDEFWEEIAIVFRQEIRIQKFQ